MIKVSLVTTLYNEVRNIERFLLSYLEQTVYADEFIIVDGGSNDGTVEAIEKFAESSPECNIRLFVDRTCSRKYVSGPIALGRNTAISHARNDIIAVTDAGCILDKNWLKEIILLFSKEVDVVAGWYEPLIENDFQRKYAAVMLPKLPIIEQEFLPSSRSIAFRKECWEKVGGYPTETFTAEDTVFDLRLKEYGFRFRFNSSAVVYWECPRNIREAMKKEYLYSYGDGQWRLFKKWYGGRAKDLIFIVKFFINRRFKLKENIFLAIILTSAKLVGYIFGLIKGKG